MDIEIRKNYKIAEGVEIPFLKHISGVTMDLRMKTGCVCLYKAYTFTYENVTVTTPEEMEFFIKEIHNF